MLAIRGFSIGAEHQPRRLPRRRVVPGPGHHHRRPRRADRPDALGRRGRQVESTRPAGSPSARSSAKAVTTDAKTGQGQRQLPGRRRPGGPATSSASPAPTGSATRSSPTGRSTISGKKDETKLRLLADRQPYKVGEEASVNLHSRGRAGTALLTWEADRILTLPDRDARARATTPVAWADRRPAVPELHAHRRADVGEPVRPGAGSTSRSSATCG